MNTQTKQFGLAAIVAVALALGACAGAGAKTGEYVDDSVITTKVKTKLLQDPTTEGFGINVTTVDGVVHLTGLVNSDEEKDRAEELANEVEGAKEVKNELTVK